jgi:5-methylcytosine-specific restriction enzyme subunit McrC
MLRVVYENEPFTATPDHTAHLARRLGGNLLVGPEGLRIIRVAGSLRLPDGSILAVRSRKAPLASLLTWAAYAYPELEALRHLGLTRSGGDEGDVAAALARVLCDELSQAVQSSGLLRHYRRQQQVSPVIRGRIDFARMSRMGANLAQVPCIVFARLPNTPLNGLFAAALDAVRRDPSMRAAAGPSLGTLTAIFADVQPRIDHDLVTGKLPLSRLERPFEASLALALLLTSAHGLREGSSVRGLAFLINLANLFERTVARALINEIPHARAKVPLHYHRGVASKPAGSMEIDVLLPGLDRGRPVVVDAKYKHTPQSANLQQIVSYCWLTGARQAALVFPAGMLRDRQPFHYRSVDGSTVTVHLVELDTEATSIEGWRTAGRVLAERIREVAAG